MLSRMMYTGRLPSKITPAISNLLTKSQIKPIQIISVSQMGFTRSFRKIVLREDVPNLGFLGEICFVKPGYAFNTLVPNG